ncbi:hypothetical protein AGMMS49936_07540 [Endomicrobiia bacterium]|nr:hypothetical protein AGMMS49936_07540 [Endomicrobiia bacterium]
MRIDNRARNDLSLFEIDTDLYKERQKDNKIHGRYNLLGLRQNTYKHTSSKKKRSKKHSS